MPRIRKKAPKRKPLILVDYDRNGHAPNSIRVKGGFNHTFANQVEQLAELVNLKPKPSMRD